MEETTQEIVSVEELANAVELSDALSRLQESYDFKFVITNGYINTLKDSIPFHFARATEAGRKSMSEKLISIGLLEKYFETIKDNGYYASRELDSYNNSKLDDTLDYT